jgi:Domain of unknown function (DUF5658)
MIGWVPPRWLVMLFLVVVCIAASASTAYPNETEEHAVSARPKALTPLCIVYGALQTLDVHSTLRALDAGAREGNPIFAPMLPGSPGVLIASKAATSAGMFLLTDRLRRQHPRAAVWTMIVLDSAYATVVANNYAAGTRARR